MSVGQTVPRTVFRTSSLRENGTVSERTKKFEVEECQGTIRWFISPTRDRQRPHVQHRAEPDSDRGFTADRPNQKWAGDLSCIWTREGCCIWRSTMVLGSMADMVTLLDLHSRRMIGWAVSNRMKRDLAIRALKMATALWTPPRGCLIHSDRGSQCCSHDDQKIMREHRLRASMRQGQLL